VNPATAAQLIDMHRDHRKPEGIAAALGLPVEHVRLFLVGYQCGRGEAPERAPESWRAAFRDERFEVLTLQAQASSRRSVQRAGSKLAVLYEDVRRMVADDRYAEARGAARP